MESLLFATLWVITLGLSFLFILKKNNENRDLKEQLHLLEKENIIIKTQLNSSGESIKRDRELFLSFQGEMENHFRGLAAQALEGSNKHFLELAKSTFEKQSQESSNLLTQKETKIENLVKPITQALSDLNKKTSDLEKERVSVFATLEGEIKRVAETNSQLAKETLALKDALKKPHIRGRWGELQLKNCIELAGMSEYSDVSFQNSVSDDENQRLIPDMTVRMPGGRVVVVDAKTPLDAFIGALEAKDDAERLTQIARHGRHVKDHVKKLSSKDYAKAVDGSADFTVMFLPNESFLYSALEAQPDLMEFALEKKILIATPPTLIGLLKVISFGWNEQKLAENATKISEAGKLLHRRLCDFISAYENVGKHLTKAKEEFQVGWSRLNSRVIVQAKKLERLGAKSNKELPANEVLNDENDNFIDSETVQ
ncbi:MAG: DNA recombination protein RmuC [Bdellovibrionaceae bacterium]|nr:DNA recombination protein RmuC [Pseudobdellovibrionaceae bacterium]